MADSVLAIPVVAARVVDPHPGVVDFFNALVLQIVDLYRGLTMAPYKADLREINYICRKKMNQHHTPIRLRRVVDFFVALVLQIVDLCRGLTMAPYKANLGEINYL